MDYYRTLGIKRNASRKAVQDAYRSLARRLHPDVNPSPAAAERFKKVNEAYDVLSDAKKRAEYDRFGANWKRADRFKRSGGGFGASGFDPSSINLSDLLGGFGSMFGFGRGGRASAGAAPPRPAKVAVAITLEEAYFGTKRDLTIGGGADARRIEVKIPRGIADGAKLAVKPRGLEIQIAVNIQPHPRFARDGANLRGKVAAPLQTMIFGGEVIVPTLDKKVLLTIPPNTQNGRVFRIRGKGMPKLNSAEFGDFLAEAVVQLPVPLSERDQALLRQMSFVGSEASA